jgi:hypothetical protein
VLGVEQDMCLLYKTPLGHAFVSHILACDAARYAAHRSPIQGAMFAKEGCNEALDGVNAQAHCKPMLLPLMCTDFPAVDKMCA